MSLNPALNSSWDKNEKEAGYGLFSVWKYSSMVGLRTEANVFNGDLTTVPK